jgi:LysM repeat protein
MQAEKALPLDGIPEAPHPTESFTAVRADVQTQLSSPKDISAATNFFKPQGAESFLPSMPTPSGMEAAALTPAGMPIPGAEQMSPLINMIMKMPGHLGLASSFFEFLGSFFGGNDMLSMLDPITGQIMDGIGGMTEHLGIDLNLLPDDAPGLTTIGDATSLEPLNNKNLLSFNSSEPLDGPGASLDHSFANAPDLNVNGGIPNGGGKPLFEQAGQETALNFAPAGENNLLAMDPGGGFGSTIGPNSGQAVDPQSLQNQLPANQNYQMQGAQQGAGFERGAGLDANGNPVNDANAAQTGADGQASSDAPETTSYTVKEGDNLWDLAGKHMGDSTRWGEIYKLNEGIIGNNPRLIMPGTELQLPGAGGLDGQHLAQDYTVKAGDNLWDISKDNLGGGEHWKDLYSNNTDVVGSNPNLIHPGQQLHMNGAEHGTHAATGHAGGHAAGNHLANGHSHHISSNHTGNHAGSHAGTHQSTAHGANHTGGHSSGHDISHAGNQNISNAGNHTSGNTPDAGHANKAISANPTKHTDVSSTPVELKAVAKSLPGIEIYQDGTVTSASTTDLGT